MDMTLTNSIRRSGHRQSGMTVIELMIGLAVAGIVLAFAIPSFENSSRNSQLRTTTMDLVTSMNTARAQAVSLRDTVTVAAIGGNWSLGWVVQYPAGSVEDDNEFSTPNGVQLVETGGINTVVFNQMGMPDAQLVFNVCDGRPNETGRLVTVTRSGRVTTEDLSPCL